MKRRLDLALALVHQPRILFLDEPTTGLDPQSRAALWEEVARLAREEGMTVFLTTQYLEEADALADRIGIIDHGKIVAEGTPAQLKAEIGSPSVEVVPVEASAGDQLARAAQRLRAAQRNGRGSVTGAAPGRRVPARRGRARARPRPICRSSRLQLHQPSLDDVFLAKTGRKLEGAGGASGRGAASLPEQVGAVGASARPGRSYRQRALLRLPDAFPADPVRDQRQRPQQGDQDPGLSDPQLPGLRARDAVRAGRDVRLDLNAARTSRGTSRPASSTASP